VVRNGLREGPWSFDFMINVQLHDMVRFVGDLYGRG
jgi:hypothetical protein